MSSNTVILSSKIEKKLKNVRVWSFLNVEGNNLLIDIHRHTLHVSFLVVYCDRYILLMRWFSFS